MTEEIVQRLNDAWYGSKPNHLKLIDCTKIVQNAIAIGDIEFSGAPLAHYLVLAGIDCDTQNADTQLSPNAELDSIELYPSEEDYNVAFREAIGNLYTGCGSIKDILAIAEYIQQKEEQINARYEQHSRIQTTNSSFIHRPKMLDDCRV